MFKETKTFGLLFVRYVNLVHSYVVSIPGKVQIWMSFNFITYESLGILFLILINLVSAPVGLGDQPLISQMPFDFPSQK